MTSDSKLAICDVRVSPSEALAKEGSSSKVLVVDDEMGIRTTLRAFLQDAGYQVDVAEDTQRARELLAAGDYDVVLSDIILPGASGVELLKAIRDASPPDIQVIMMTGEPNVATAAEAVRVGAFGLPDEAGGQGSRSDVG